MFSDEIWTFFLTYRLQLAFAIAALLINLVLCVYAFTAGDCYNPHTSMWRTQLVIDILVALGYVLDATSAFRFRKFCYYSSILQVSSLQKSLSFFWMMGTRGCPCSTQQLPTAWPSGRTSSLCSSADNGQPCSSSSWAWSASSLCAIPSGFAPSE